MSTDPVIPTQRAPSTGVMRACAGPAPSRRRRRRVRGLAIGAAVIALLAGCGRQVTPASTTEPSRSDVAEPAGPAGTTTSVVPPPQRLMASCTTDGAVRVVAVADDVAYIGGEFGTVYAEDGTPAARRNVAACELSSGEVLDWYPSGGVEGLVLELAVEGTWVYVGGEFGRIGKRPMLNLARLSTADGAVDPAWAPQPDREVVLVHPTGSGAVYVGGLFNRIASDVQPGLARIDAGGDLDPTFRPRFGFDQGRRAGVYAIAHDEAANDLYVAGKFTSVNGRPRASAAAIDDGTGLLTMDFAPELEDTNPKDDVVQVAEIALHDGAIYLCGDYWQIEGIGEQEEQRNVGRFDPRSGAADNDWVPTTDGGVQDCALSPRRDALLIGGHYDHVNGRPQRKLAAISLQGDGGHAPWLEADSVAGVWSVDALPDGRVVLGGAFTQIGEVDHAGFAVLSP